MAQSDDDALPGKNIKPGESPGDIVIPEGQVKILHSGYGIEGVFTNENLLASMINDLRKMAAYRNGTLSISVYELNPR